MASPDVDSPWLCAASESFGGCFNIQIDEVKSTNNVKVLEAPTSSVFDARTIPKPPPYPSTTSTTTSHCKRISASCSVPKETKDTWDRLFKEAYGSDVYIITYRNSYIPAHCNVLDREIHFTEAGRCWIFPPLENPAEPLIICQLLHMLHG